MIYETFMKLFFQMQIILHNNSHDSSLLQLVVQINSNLKMIRQQNLYK